MKKLILVGLLLITLQTPAQALGVKKLIKAPIAVIVFPFKVINNMIIEIQDAIYVKRKLEMSYKHQDFILVEGD